MISRFVVPALAAVSTLTLAGCATSPESASSNNEFMVIATTTQVADFARNVLGSDDNLRQLMRPNQSVHGYDPSSKDLAVLGNADVLVSNGMGLEEWLDDVTDASGFNGIIVDTSASIDAVGHEGDPHVWPDVANAILQVQSTVGALSEADPANANTYEANGQAYSDKLVLLDEWIRDGVDQVPVEQRLFVSNHDVFGYFSTAYGITYVGSVIPSFDDNAEPSAAEIDKLVAAIKDTAVKAVFSEASISPKAADMIAREAGVKVYSGEDALYGDSLGPAGSNGDTYIKAQIQNVTLILESWSAKPMPLPADLQ